jgi:cysteinyl-tRNA synthetase
MPIRFHNTLTRKVEEFAPSTPGAVRMYNCGPTVYSSPHIGNFRTFLLSDLLRRFFEWKGLKVTQVMNLTDVGHLLEDAEEGEDKLEAAAKKEKVRAIDIAQRYTDEFFAALDYLGFRKAHHYPKATEHIPEMIAMIETLVARASPTRSRAGTSTSTSRSSRPTGACPATRRSTWKRVRASR